MSGLHVFTLGCKSLIEHICNIVAYGYHGTHAFFNNRLRKLRALIGFRLILHDLKFKKNIFIRHVIDRRPPLDTQCSFSCNFAFLYMETVFIFFAISNY
jgi:hypothetical protein